MPEGKCLLPKGDLPLAQWKLKPSAGADYTVDEVVSGGVLACCIVRPAYRGLACPAVCHRVGAVGECWRRVLWMGW